MAMQYRELGPGIYEIQTDIGTHTWQEALNEVRDCTATNPDENGGVLAQGAREVMVQGSACQNIVDYFKSNLWYQDIADLCQQDDQWVLNWAWPTVDWFRRHTRLDYMWHRAPPCYTNHQYHADALRMVVHGLMYLSPENDPKATTLFCDHDREYAVSTGFDRGWAVLQNGSQLHRGINLNHDARYVFKWMFTLKI